MWHAWDSKDVSDANFAVGTLRTLRLASRSAFARTTSPAGIWGPTARVVAEAVARNEANLGIVCCFTGTGVSMEANKVQGIRAALCVDAETGRGARKWNDANVLALSLRLLTKTLAVEIVDAFMESTYTGTEAECLAVL